jgi:Holliday junction DNA helicase RuvA
MIGSLNGTVRGIVRGVVVVEVSGIGYGVATVADTLAKAKEGAPIFLWTHLAVRENAHDLYGFETKEELQWFELLLTVSGIGPRSALAILNGVDPKTLERAIARGDASSLERAYGIGKRTAAKIVLELRDKVGAVEEGGASGIDGDVVDVLVGLGYSSREARDAVKALPGELMGAEARIREAIRIASQTR